MSDTADNNPFEGVELALVTRLRDKKSAVGACESLDRWLSMSNHLGQTADKQIDELIASSDFDTMNQYLSRASTEEEDAAYRLMAVSYVAGFATQMADPGCDWISIGRLHRLLVHLS